MVRQKKQRWTYLDLQINVSNKAGNKNGVKGDLFLKTQVTVTHEKGKITLVNYVSRGRCFEGKYKLWTKQDSKWYVSYANTCTSAVIRECTMYK